MSRQRLWTEKEIKKLELLYPSGRAFEEIVDAFPKRSANAIRQKASRLGLRRPTISPSLFNSQNVLSCSDENGEAEEYLFKCSGCGSWIHVNLYDEDEGQIIVCRQCHTIYRHVA